MTGRGGSAGWEPPSGKAVGGTPRPQRSDWTAARRAGALIGRGRALRRSDWPGRALPQRSRSSFNPLAAPAASWWSLVRPGPPQDGAG